MKVKVILDHSGRRGKQVTLVKGITHNPQVIDALAKKIKQHCGAGGTVKGKDIEIQGNHVPKVKALLEKEGYFIT